MSEPSTPSTGLSGSKTEDTLHPGTEPPDSLTGELRRRVLSINLAVTLLAFVLALAIGAVLIAASAPSVIESLGYFFARPLIPSPQFLTRCTRLTPLFSKVHSLT